MTARVALPLMIKPLLYVPAASGSSMLQTTIYALQCALSLRPIRTRHNSTNVSNVPSEARENEAVIAEVSRYGGVAKSRLFASYIPVGMRVVSV